MTRRFLLATVVLGLLQMPTLVLAFAPQRQPSSLSSSSLQMSSKPFAVVVEAEIDPTRMEEFLEMIKTNAENSRKEPGCIRFDVLRSQENPNKFTFYELYNDMAAVDFHKTQPHYNAWASFKESGGTVSSVSYKNDGEFVGM